MYASIGIIACIAGVGGCFAFSMFWGGSNRYSLLTVLETNTKGLIAIPLEGDCPRAARWEEQSRTLVPLKTEYAPDRRTKCLVVYDVDFAGVRVSSDARKIPSFPYRIDLGVPISVIAQADPPGDAPEADAVIGVPVPVCDNRLRLFTGELSLDRISSDGVATLSLDGEDITVAPGQAWTVARIREGSSTAEIRPGPGWEAALTKAFENGSPISRLTIINYGLWEKERVEKCGY
ncbi:MAG: hypothetical protein ACM3X4_01980 [Ignavibacteriales bacterium]